MSVRKKSKKTSDAMESLLREFIANVISQYMPSPQVTNKHSRLIDVKIWKIRLKMKCDCIDTTGAKKNVPQTLIMKT